MTAQFTSLHVFVGIRLGDVIFGINFIPTREGSKTLITVIKLETEKHKKFLHIQGWRCHQLCSDPIPGYLFPRADDMFVRGYDLAMSKVFNDWERWNFIEIILGYESQESLNDFITDCLLVYSYCRYMVEDLHNRAQSVEGIDMRGISFSSAGRVRARQMQALDLEKNILQAKGLRSAINVRIVQTKNKDDTVVYILRVEDVESGLVWMVSRRYNEFHTLYEELNDITHSIRDVDFPRKRLTLRLSVRVVEQRVTMLEQFLRKSIHTLTHHASIDSTASNALRRIQHFLAVEKHVDCIHPPVLDDQRTIELMAYRFLNDFNSPACLQCVRFTNSVELDGQLEYGEEGYRGLLSFMHDALAEVEQFVQQQHEAQLLLTLQSRRPEWTEDQQLKLVRQCIRRQVEAALYLPLRRSMVRLLLSSLETKVKSMQRAVAVMMPAKPSVFMVDPNVVKTKSFPKAVTALRKALLAHLPSDQGQFLVEAANIISEVHTESKDMQRATRRLSLSPKASSTSLSTAGQKAVMSQTASSSSATRSSSNDKVAPSSSSRKSIDRMRSPIYSDGHHDELRGRDSFSSSGQKLRQSLSDRLSNLLSPSDAKKDSTPHDSEDDLDVGLDDEILRVSFTVTHNHHAVSLGPDEQLRFTASTAKKIATYTPKRDIAGLERHIFETTPADSVRHSAADEESAKKEDGNEGVILSSFPSPVSDPLRDSPHLQRPLPPVPVAGHSERKGGEGVDPLRSDPLQSVSSVSPAYVSGSSVDELTRATGSLVISSSQPTAQSSVYNNYAGNRQSTRQLDRMTSSRQADAFVDPLLHPPTEDEIHCGNHVDTAIFAEVFDRYRGTYDAPPNEDGEDEEVILTLASVAMLFLTYIFCIIT